jgi:sphingolipid delta-4 desaturase
METETRTDFYWSDYQYPHSARGRAILQKYGPEVKKLMVIEPKTKYYLTPLVLLQIYLGLISASMSWSWFLFTAYAAGGTLTHIFFLAIHEITHNLAFKKPFFNDLYAMFVNLPIGVPVAMAFKSYHSDHHRYLGWEDVDPDLPTAVEAKLLSTLPGKIFFLFFQILFYALRPCIVRPFMPEKLHVLNYVVQFSFVGIVYYLVGYWPIVYWILSDVLGASFLHPLAGHFLAEHYVFDGAGKQETFSYYGMFNKISWNVGYHNEHHDIPNIPWSKLPELRRIAPEFYDDLVQSKAWPVIVWEFLSNQCYSSYSRVKREKGRANVRPLLPTNEVGPAMPDFSRP